MRRQLSRVGGAATTGILLAGLGLLALAQVQPPNPKVLKGVREQLAPTTEAKAAPAAKSQSTPGVAKRRDPFRSLMARADEMVGQALPPGKRGLVIAQLNVNGVVVTPTEMIAVVNMTGRNRAYFLRERDELYNGTVHKITEDGVVFKEKTMDAFGKEYEREVVKQITTGTGSGRSGPGAKR